MKELFKQKLFWVGLAIRLLLLPFFGSIYLKDLFIPFLDSALQNPGVNPWSLSPPHFFPYGSVLFVLLYIPKLVGFLMAGQLALGSTALSIALMKIPLLLLDFTLLATLINVTPQRTKAILLAYWLSPVVIYISYIHGQLDVAAIAFCVLALVMLLRKNIPLSATLMALATLCKFSVVFVVPFLLTFLWNTNFAKIALQRIVQWSALWVTISVLGFLPHVFSQRFFYVTASSPEALRIFGMQLHLPSSQVLYVGAAILALVLGRLCLSIRISERGLLYGSGILLGLLVTVTDAMPGWYFWTVPFLALFYAEYAGAHKLLFWMCQALFLTHFVALPQLDLEPSGLWHGVTFTLLQASVVGQIIAIWGLVIHREMPMQGRARPMVIGIAGDSGAGKDTLSSALCNVFNVGKSLIVEGDDYHKWERGHEKWRTYTHLSPRANHLSALADHTKSLAAGRFVFQPHYDHSTGQFTEPREIRPNRTIIIQGLHALYLKNMRDTFDLKIFLAPHEMVRLYWKISRDVKKRGHSVEKVLSSLLSRVPDSQNYIEPQRAFADWTIEFFPKIDLTREQIIEGAEPELAVRHTIWNDASVFEMAEALETHAACQVSVEISSIDISKVTLTVEGNPTATQIAHVSEILFPNLRHLTRGRNPPAWHGGLEGVSQIVSVALLWSRVT